MIDVKLIAAGTGCSPASAARYQAVLSAAADKYGINTTDRLAAWLANVGHESGGLVYAAEIWGPTAAQRGYDSGRGYEKSTLTAKTTNASNVLTGIASTRGLWVGIPVSGAGIPANTTITQINSATSVTSCRHVQPIRRAHDDLALACPT